MQDIRYSPHFCVYKDGRRVDEFDGDSAQRLRDRLWLHHPRVLSNDARRDSRRK